MRARATGGTLLIRGTLLILYCSLALGLTARSGLADNGQQRRPPSVFYGPASWALSHQNEFTAISGLRRSRATRSSAISCVPYVRGHSDVKVVGNAWQWWSHAAGLYERGNMPEVGGVLVFQANRHMHLGHVAVVSNVLNSRLIEIDQSNWPTGHGATHRVPVVDVSDRNDWTAVRVALGHSERFGSIYPTYGFIYARPDTGRLVTATWSPAPLPLLNPAPSDLRYPTNDQAAETPMQRRIVPSRHSPVLANSGRHGSRG